MHRYAIVQNKVIPWILSIVHAPFPALVYGYLVNDLLVYLLFFSVAIFLKEYLLAAFFLLFNLLLWKLNFFVLSSELFLTLPWLFLWCLLLHRDKTDPVLLVPLLFLIVWSHPVCIIVFVLINFLFGYEKKLNRWSLALFAILLLLRIWLLSGYDMGKISEAVGSSHGYNLPDFLDYLTDYFHEYWLFFFLSVFWIVNNQIALWRKGAVILVWIVLFLLCYNNGFTPLHMDFTKWLLPVHFTGIYALYLSMAEARPAKKWLLAANVLVMVTLIMDWCTIYRNFRNYQLYADNIHCLVSATRKRGLSKSYIVKEEFEPRLKSYNAFQEESLQLSQFPIAGKPVHVVIIPEEMETYITNLGHDTLYMGPDYYYSTKVLKPPFKVQPGVYRKLIPSDCPCLKAQN
jgi:hypothetical protein